MTGNFAKVLKCRTPVLVVVLSLAPLLDACAAQQNGAGRSVSSPADSADAEASATRISGRILTALVQTSGVPGMGAAIWRDGRVVWAGSAGFRDLERELPVDENTVFRLASVSKLFAAAAAAKLVESGDLKVDAPVQSIVGYLPDHWPAITSSQLAAHTSGIPHYQAVDQDRGRRKFTSVRDAVGVFQNRSLLFTPQERYSYSSFGYTLLSAVIEETSGLSYLDYLSRAITTDLKIGRDATDTDNPDASKVYEFANGAIRGAAPHDYSYGWGGAGLGATAPDLARFGGRMLTGGTVSRETFEWMLIPAHLADGSPVIDGDRTPGGSPTSVGFGWRSARDADGERIAHHSGVTNGARSTLVLYPERGEAISVLSNTLWVSAIEQTAIMLAAPFHVDEGVATPACPTSATSYEGIYNDEPVSGDAHVTEEDGACTAVISVRNAFGDWLNTFPQKDVETLTFIGVAPGHGLGRAALVTPIGVYDVRVEDYGTDYVANLGSRTFSMSFRPVGGVRE